MSNHSTGPGADDSASKPRSRREKRAARIAARAVEAKNELPVPLDDIPDMPATYQGGFALPNVPSAALDPGARDWVSRFLPGPEPERAFRAESCLAERSDDASVATFASPHHTEPVLEDAQSGSAAPRAAAPASPYSAASRSRKRGRSRGRGRGHGGAVLAIGAAAGLAALIVLAAQHYQWDGLRPLGSETRRAVASGPEAGAPAVSSESAAPSAELATAAVKTMETKTKTKAKAEPEGIKPRPALKPPGAATGLPAEDRAAHATGSSDPVPAAPENATPATETPARRYGLEVATFIVEDRALAERDRLAVTGYRVFLQTEGEGDTATYRLVLGTFASRDDAARAADALLGAGTVQQSRIVRLPAEN